MKKKTQKNCIHSKITVKIKFIHTEEEKNLQRKNTEKTTTVGEKYNERKKQQHVNEREREISGDFDFVFFQLKSFTNDLQNVTDSA